MEVKISILGTTYKIIIENFGSNIRDGYCNYVKKEIHVDSQCSKEYQKHILRHEIIHAFFFESGLENYNNDEKLVSWIAMQFDKIEKVYKEVLEDEFN